MRLPGTVLTIGIIYLGMLSIAHAQDYDLVINGGRVMDPETMYDDIANVGIKDGRIAAITKDEIAGKETINAKGLVAQTPSEAPIGVDEVIAQQPVSIEAW